MIIFKDFPLIITEKERSPLRSTVVTFAFSFGESNMLSWEGKYLPHIFTNLLHSLTSKNKRNYISRESLVNKKTAWLVNKKFFF
jgi:hypothetical protein